MRHASRVLAIVFLLFPILAAAQASSSPEEFVADVRGYQQEGHPQAYPRLLDALPPVAMWGETAEALADAAGADGIPLIDRARLLGMSMLVDQLREAPEEVLEKRREAIREVLGGRGDSYLRRQTPQDVALYALASMIESEGGDDGGLLDDMMSDTGYEDHVFEEFFKLIKPEEEKVGMTAERAAELLGGRETYDAVIAMLEEQKALTEEMAHRFTGREPTAEELEEARAVEEEFVEKHSKAVEAWGMIEDQELFVFLIGKVNPEMAARFSGRRRSSGDIPPLLKRYSREEAEPWLHAAFVKPIDWSTPYDHEETLAWVREEALENKDSFGKPQWDWIDRPEMEPLFNAFLEKFGPGREGTMFERALNAAIFARALREDTEGAAELAALGEVGRLYQFDSEMVPTEEQMRNLFNTFLAIQRKHPGKDLWGDLLMAAAGKEEAEQVRALAREVYESDAGAGERAAAGAALSHTLLADNKSEEALSVLLEAGKLALGAGDLETATEAANRLLEISEADRNVAMFKEAVTLAEAVALAATGESYYNRGFAKVAEAMARWPEQADWEGFERLVTEAVERTEAAKADREVMFDIGGSGSSSLKRLLIDSAYIQGNMEEVLLRARAFPGWDARNISELIQADSYFSQSAAGVSYPYMIAHALAEMGEAETSRAIAKALLPRDLGNDDLYELYLRGAEPDAALAFFKELAKLDRFEERPLIWSAEVLRRQGNLDEAAEFAQRAISIDPSDGEKGPGDRMRVYAVLRDIRKAQGNDEDAAFLSSVVAAIRRSEEADKLWEAGRVGEAIEVYEESLNMFAGAYCIQSRLALRLAAEGRMEEAAEHYEKAFELMPDSFGRIESHCFGCEGAFSGETAQEIAERVFTKLLEERPEDAKLHYLLGYLRSAQDREEEAADYYRRAAELDPQYFNAYDRLLDLGKYERIEMSEEEMEEISLKMIALDPALNRLYGLPDISDAARLFEIGRENIVWQDLFSVPDGLFAFPASADALDERPAGYGMYRRPSDVIMGPGDYLIALPKVKNSALLFDERFF